MGVGWLDFCVCWEGMGRDRGPLDQEHLMGIWGQARASLSLDEVSERWGVWLIGFFDPYSFSSSAFPSYIRSLGFTILGKIFAHACFLVQPLR